MGLIFPTLYAVSKSLCAALVLIKDLSFQFNLVLERAARLPGLSNPLPTQPYWLNEPPFPDLVNVRSPELPETADVVIIGS